ncbi:MAG: DUF4260 domain-containing protein [Trueperaceae bacterium]|nr:DUF4260 domain-containing protein [Trueperaceae bacterium]
MRMLLKLEELAQLIACVVLLIVLGAPWWCYLLLLIAPDTGMLGYLAGPRFGAMTYNLLHHKAVALLLVAFAFVATTGSSTPGPAFELLAAGLILYGHASLDRLFGYGLKHSDSFQNTHLGRIGRER